MPDEGGWCLKAARLIVEDALLFPSHSLYRHYLVAGTTRRQGEDAERLAAARENPYAADLEASMKRLGLGVPFAERRPGDLIFNANALPPYGHVGVLLDGNTVVESIDPRYRKASVQIGPALVLTPIQSTPWTLVARLQPLA